MGYVYLLYFETDDKHFYVGQTTQSLNRRITQHKVDAKKQRTEKQNWIFQNGRFNLKHKILYEGIELDFYEKKHIAEFKSKSCVLYNMTEGGSGDGTKGYRHTDTEKLRRSLENPGRDYKIYTFKNINGDSFTGTRVDFRNYSNLSRVRIGNLINRKTKFSNGWYEITAAPFVLNEKGAPKRNENRRSKSIYNFVHPAFGGEKCTCYDLIQKYNLDDSKIYSVVKGKRKHHKGWFIDCLKKTSNPVKPFVYHNPVIRIKNGKEKKYNCINDIIVDMNMRRTASHYIKQCCEGKRTSYLGFDWSYEKSSKDQQLKMFLNP